MIIKIKATEISYKNGDQIVMEQKSVIEFTTLVNYLPKVI